MPKLSRILLPLLITLSAHAETAQVVKGRVELGEWPPEPKAANRYLRAPVPEAPPGKRDRFAVVWLEPKGFTLPPAAPGTYEIVQEGLEFKPYLLCVPTGATVSFPNNDDVHHNVFSYSPAKKFDLGRYLKMENPPSITFDKPGEVKLFCEVHKSMRASIFVVNTTYLARSDEAGMFQFPKVLPGTYTLHARVDDKLRHEVPLVVSDNAPPPEVILALPKTIAP